MAGRRWRRRLLPLLLLLPLLFPALLPLPLPSPPPGNASLPASGCLSEQFPCKPGSCIPIEWRCDGHPDCDEGEDEWGCDEHLDCRDEEDEWDCETATPMEPSPTEPSPGDAWVTPPRSSAVLPIDSAETSGTAVLEGSVPSRTQGHLWILVIAAESSPDVQAKYCEWFSACALSSLVLLSILVAVGSLVVWGLSRAKSRSDIFSLEKASREQLIPDKSQTGSCL